MYQGKWYSLLATRRLDAVWELWTRLAEESLLAWSSLA